MASLAICHLELVVWDGNLVKFILPKYQCIIRYSEGIKLDLRLLWAIF